VSSDIGRGRVQQSGRMKTEKKNTKISLTKTKKALYKGRNKMKAKEMNE
jgi:hypothetical protein